MQDDVNARLQASQSKEGVTLQATEGDRNPASQSSEPSETGLAQRDAGVQADETPVEDKIETVAGAIEKEEETRPQPERV